MQTVSYEKPDNPWSEDSDYPVKDWQYVVKNGDTLLGYWEWVALERELRDNDSEVK